MVAIETDTCSECGFPDDFHAPGCPAAEARPSLLRLWDDVMIQVLELQFTLSDDVALAVLELQFASLGEDS